MDGKIIEFKAPILVKELLMGFEGFEVKSSRKSSNHHPPNFELQLGETYYLIPSSKSPDEAINPTATKGESDDHSKAVVKRIKVVITKKQLQEMLSNKTSLENIIIGIDKACLVNWRPNLTSIPEENELNTM
ncbi:hypothetical protein PHJA_001019600 [Phtheirospermum japonicum]|uniref:Uncharacterized protein n=1 Tax=Phtheirospermum japonicum TaxID=374723 RepID=A0A830BS25_9LAMI|nr:hypothetical protein PHJA_001019600 [Phtheirospermum japonicum]